jgi:hypothetical protein
MLESFIGTWWSMTSAYFGAPFALLAGTVSSFTILPTIGLILLILGIVLAFSWGEKQTRWVGLPALAAALAPFVVGYMNIMMGWFGVLFFLVLGGVGLLGWVGVIASDARKRSPVWLTGFFPISYLVFCGMVSVAVIWGWA